MVRKEYSYLPVKSRRMWSLKLNDYTERLRLEGVHLIILKDGQEIFASSEEGMRPLLKAIHRLGLPTLKGSIVVDKIVGKAAALLISYFKARETYCIVLSKKAQEVLEKHGIRSCAETVIPEITNRLGNDICPFEKAVLTVDDPKDGYELLLEKLKLQNARAV